MSNLWRTSLIGRKASSKQTFRSSVISSSTKNIIAKMEKRTLDGARASTLLPEETSKADTNGSNSTSIAVNSGFVRQVSHEIRTPLCIVISSLELLKSMKHLMQAEIYEVVDDIRSATSVITSTLDNLIALGEIESKSLRLEKEDFDPVDIVTSAVSNARMKSNKISLLNNVKSGSLVVNADLGRLHQAVRNLLTETLHLSGGHASISLSQTVDGSRIGSRIRVEVNDPRPKEGREGAENGQQEPIEAVEDIGKLKDHKLSFDVAISKRIVEMHGGEFGISLLRASGRFRFVFELSCSPNPSRIVKAEGEAEVRKTSPVERDDASTSETRESFTSQRLRVLIVDDVVLCRKMHGKLLRNWFGELIEASNGSEAVDIVADSIKTGRVIHGIIMDNSMPLMPGTTATKRIRELGYRGKIFGVTGNGLQADVDDFLSHGANEVLVKPLPGERYNYIARTIISSSSCG